MELSASSRTPGWMKGCSNARGRPCRLTVCTLCAAQPSRARARLNADGAGMIRTSPVPNFSARMEPTP